MPDAFLAVQWTEAPGGEGAGKFAANVLKLLDRAGPAMPAATMTSRSGEAAAKPAGPSIAVLALTLACLGRAEEARGELAQVEPLVGGRAPNVYRGPVVLLLAQTRGVLGDYSAMAPWVRKLFAEYSANPFTPASFSHDARFSTALAAPEIAALLKEFAQLDLPVAGKSEVSAPIDLKSVAVLAFANLSDDKGNEYFSDGISEELLNVLAKIPGLKVAARTSAFFFKGRNVPITEIARTLGVAHVVEGSVFDIYVFRSYADYCWEFLLATARAPARVKLFGNQATSA